jgi:hypothetical protein
MLITIKSANKKTAVPEVKNVNAFVRFVERFKNEREPVKRPLNEKSMKPRRNRPKMFTIAFAFDGF